MGAAGDTAAGARRSLLDARGVGGHVGTQELATAAIDNLETKVLLLNNQHLGMVVQWEDRFYKANRAHTYLGRREAEWHESQARGRFGGFDRGACRGSLWPVRGLTAARFFCLLPLSAGRGGHLPRLCHDGQELWRVGAAHHPQGPGPRGHPRDARHAGPLPARGGCSVLGCCCWWDARVTWRPGRCAVRSPALVPNDGYARRSWCPT